jgi:hypothetical protein
MQHGLSSFDTLDNDVKWSVLVVCMAVGLSRWLSVVPLGFVSFLDDFPFSCLVSIVMLVKAMI